MSLHQLYRKFLPILVSVALGLATANAFAATVSKITLTVPNKTLKVGLHETLKAVAKDASGHTITGVKFTWTSSKKTIVKVGTTGVVTALNPGTSTIKATSGTKSASVIITVPAPTSVAGVAAKGTALAGATITLVDKTGKTLSTTTGLDGSYTLNTTALASPFLVRVQTDTSTLYSVSDATTASKVINVTPLTDLIIRSWYSVQGIDIATAFAHPSTNPPPSPTEVKIIGNVVVQVTSLWLQQNSVDTTDFSFISTPFSADGTGVDAVLDLTTVNTDTGAITITDGTTTQDSNVTYGTGALTVDTSTSGPDGSSSSSTGTVVATSTAMQTALTGITSTLTNFANAVNAKGSALKSTDVSPFMDSGLLNEGLGRTLFADNIATEFHSLSSVSFTLLKINSLDPTGGLADVNLTFTSTQDSQTQNQTIEFFFKKQANGTWLLFGNQLPANLNVSSEMRTNQGANASAGGPDINVDIRPITGLYTGITIDGGGVFSNAALTKQDQLDVTILTPNPAIPSSTVEVDRDAFFVGTPTLVDLVPAGTPMTITMTLADTSTKQYTVNTNAFTTEAISITSPTGSTLADADLDGTLHVEWTLPKTFAVAQVKLGAVTFTADFQCQIEHPVLSATATSADIVLPSTCTSNGVTEDVTSANLNLNVIGVNGEHEFVDYEFQN